LSDPSSRVSSPIFSSEHLLQRWQTSTRSPCERFTRFSKIIFDL
jgi:hypothetical protein